MNVNASPSDGQTTQVRRGQIFETTYITIPTAPMNPHKDPINTLQTIREALRNNPSTPATEAIPRNNGVKPNKISKNSSGPPTHNETIVSAKYAAPAEPSAFLPRRACDVIADTLKGKRLSQLIENQLPSIDRIDSTESALF